MAIVSLPWKMSEKTGFVQGTKSIDIPNGIEITVLMMYLWDLVEINGTILGILFPIR